MSPTDNPEQQLLIYSSGSYNNVISPVSSSLIIDREFSLLFVDLIQNIGGSLYQKYAPSTNPEHDFIPQLAADLPSISDNGTKYRIKLREGVKFSDGNYITTEDVLFSYFVYMTPWINIHRYHVLTKVLGENIGNTSISIIDINTIEFRFLDASIHNFEALIGFPILQATELNRNKYNSCLSGIKIDCIEFFSDSNPFIGSGPYKVDIHDRANHQIELVKNEFYYDNELWSDRIIYKGGLPNNVTLAAIDHIPDIILMANNAAIMATWAKPHPYIPFDYIHSQVLKFELNSLHPIFGTGEDIPYGLKAISDNNQIQAKMVRKAISYATDRDHQTEVLWGTAGISTGNLIPMTAFGYNESLVSIEFSLDLAKHYIELAGFDYSTIVDGNGDGDYSDENDTRFFDFSMRSFPSTYGLLEHQVDLYSKIGIGFEPIPIGIEYFDIISFFHRNNSLIGLHSEGGWDGFVTMNKYGIPYETQHEFTTRGLCTSDGDQFQCNNWGNYQNIILDSLTLELDDATNYIDRKSILNQMENFLVEELPAIPIAYGASPAPVKNDVIMADSTYFDVRQFRWELVHKTSWKDPTLEDINDEASDPQIVLLMFSGVALIITIAFVFRKRVS